MLFKRFLLAVMLLALLAQLFAGSPTGGVVYWTELVVIVSAVAIMLQAEFGKTKRQVAAIERYLTIGDVRSSAIAAIQELGDRSSAVTECAQRLELHLSQIIGERHPRTSRAHHDWVRDYIANHFSQNGWSVRLEPVKGPDGPGHNVIAEKQGSDPNAGIWIIGAHYDTVIGTPGADDNGIAVASVLALCELLGPFQFSSTVRLVAWDFEERQRWGRGLIGSRTMVKKSQALNEQVCGVICLEMIGMCDHRPGSQQMFPGLRWIAPQLYAELTRHDLRADFIAVVSNRNAHPIVSALADAFGQYQLPSVDLQNKGLTKLIRDLRRSDHAPFWDAGIPAVMLTDTSNFRNPFYHSLLDRIETIDFGFAAKTTLACNQAIEQLAGVKRSVVFLFPPVGHCLDARDDVFDLLKAKGYQSVWHQFYRADSEQECIDEAKEIIDDHKPILVAVPNIMMCDQWIKDEASDWEGGLTKLVNYIEKEGIPIYWIKLSEIGFGGAFDDELMVRGNREEFVKKLLSYQKTPV